MKIYFVTKNSYKFKSFTSEININDIEILQLPVETIEIQANNNREIAEFSAKWVADTHGLTVVKEDIGLYIEALDGFPGPYLNFIEDKIKTEGYLRLMKDITNRKAYWEYAVAYCEPGKDPISFSTHHEGTISTEAKGDTDFFIPKIFIPKGQEKTISELINEGMYKRNIEHYKELEQYLLTLKNQ